jgi:hypothetical protein
LTEQKKCVNCNTTETYVNRKGYEVWRNDEKGNVLCKRCWQNLIANPKYNPAGHKKFNPRRLTFKNKQIFIPYDFRTGVCNLCRAVFPFDTAKVDFHHEKYDESDPLKYTIEICASCHVRETWRLRKIAQSAFSI